MLQQSCYGSAMKTIETCMLTGSVYSSTPRPLTNNLLLCPATEGLRETAVNSQREGDATTTRVAQQAQDNNLQLLEMMLTIPPQRRTILAYAHDRGHQTQSPAHMCKT